MTSIVSICNLALSNLGKDNISALTDAGAEARACRQFYDHTRDMLLQSYPWRWAGKTISLAEISNDKAGLWGYAYARPNDCLKIRHVTGDESDLTPRLDAHADDFGVRHEIEGGVIYADISPAFLRYTWRVVDPTKYPPLFVEALAWHLTVRLAMPLTRDPKERSDAFTLANGAQVQAQVADANEVREWMPETSDTIEARS